ncbi:nucleotidyltransferase family protein [Bradyrhizobium sp. SZCCHNS1054]|uniref:nucleotidyltransferase family protein n=1 Tax=Bradyrhizobium sp. SZCCHNS1054 TaxID=3057301 RepID=UPI002916693D|nr:nucleotidyltransferase family protein [Bradyrhizobium sp. SZCCHNS1054]
MRALLLAAGIGSRLRPITATTPKCLVKINDRPLLDYWLELLFEGGVDRVLINTHWLAEQVWHHVQHSHWRPRIDVVHEPELLGTGGTVLKNRGWFLDQPFLVVHADNLTDFDIRGLIAAHERPPHEHLMTMLGFRTDSPCSCGIVELGTDHKVVAFHEKVQNPPGNLANGAVYIVEQPVVDMIADIGRPFVDFSTEIIPRLVGRIRCFETAGYHRDIGTVESLYRARIDFPQRLAVYTRRAPYGATTIIN